MAANPGRSGLAVQTQEAVDLVLRETVACPGRGDHEARGQLDLGQRVVVAQPVVERFAHAFTEGMQGHIPRVRGAPPLNPSS